VGVQLARERLEQAAEGVLVASLRGREQFHPIQVTRRPMSSRSAPGLYWKDDLEATR
jgi:hypothetical protein